MSKKKVCLKCETIIQVGEERFYIYPIPPSLYTVGTNAEYVITGRYACNKCVNEVKQMQLDEGVLHE